MPLAVLVPAPVPVSLAAQDCTHVCICTRIPTPAALGRLHTQSPRPHPRHTQADLYSRRWILGKKENEVKIGLLLSHPD